ncbi:MAG: dihydroorotate dehydrogenase electron transfer subunit [Patescibacteria group bacterium]
MERPLGTIEKPKVLPISKIIVENERVKTFFFNIEWETRPGQFAILWIPRVNEKPFCISHNENGEIGFTICHVGDFTHKLFDLKVGDPVGIRGPYGSWFKTENDYKTILLAGGGYGVAPLYNLAKSLEKKDIQIHFCNGARTNKQLLYIKQLKQANVSLHISTDDGSQGQKGTVIDTAIKCLEEDKIDCAYFCGPELMEKKLVELCIKKNIPSQVSIERYMKCGFGICGQCCLDDSGDRMCQEGPVISGIKAMQHSEFGKYHRNKSGVKQYYENNQTKKL